MAGERRKIDYIFEFDGINGKDASQNHNRGRVRDTPSNMSKKKKAFLIIFSLLSALLIAITILTIANFSRHASPISSEIKEKVPFATYYPSKIPVGYSIKPASVSSDLAIVSLEITNQNQNSIFITQQEKPGNFDFDFFYNKTLLVSRELDTEIGKARIGSAKGRGSELTASIISGQTWILMVFSDSIPQVEIDTILLSLTPA